MRHDVPFSAAPGRGAAQRIYRFRRSRGRSIIFLCFFRAAPACVGILGGHAGLFDGTFVPATEVDEKFFQKNAAPGKKPLLFLAQMLYNKKKWVQASKGGRQEWQSKERGQGL